MEFFRFPEDARWNAGREAVEFSVMIGGYEGTVTVTRRAFQGLFDQTPTPQRCLEAFHLQRTRFEIIVERKLRRRQLTDDGNVEITSRDLREVAPSKIGFSPFGARRIEPALRSDPSMAISRGFQIVGTHHFSPDG